MGFMDDLLSSGVSALGDNSSGLLGAAAQFLQNQPGGVSGTLQQLRDGGLGSVVDSWISTEANQAISADQIESAIGSDRIQSIASSLGVDPQTLTQGLSQALPNLVDQLSPNGQLPDSDSLLQSLKGLL